MPLDTARQIRNKVVFPQPERNNQGVKQTITSIGQARLRLPLGFARARRTYSRRYASRSVSAHVLAQPVVNPSDTRE